MQRLFAAITPGAAFVQRCRWLGPLLSILIVFFGISTASFTLANQVSPPSDPKLALTTPPPTPNDPEYWRQWNLNDSEQAKLQFEQAWNISNKGSGVVIAVIDTGIDVNHEDLSGQLWTNADEIPGNGKDDDNNRYTDDVNGYDFAAGDGTLEDNNGHGTNVAGIIAAATNNGKGIAGIAWNSKLMILKVPGGDSQWSAMAEAIEYAVQNGAKVINISIASYDCSEGKTTVVRNAILDAYDKGIVVVAGSGNRDENIVGCPASLDGVIAVGATNESDERCQGPIVANNCMWVGKKEDLFWSGSSYGDNLDLVAPGGTSTLAFLRGHSLRATNLDPKYTTEGGTSIATPHVSGLIALMLSVNPNLTPYQIQDILQRTAYKNTSKYRFSERIDEGGWNNEVGFGRIDAYGAVNAVANPPWVTNIRILLGIMSGGFHPINGDHSSQVALIVQLQDPNHTVVWGPLIVPTGSTGYSPGINLNYLAPGTYDICAKPMNHLGICKSVTLAVGQNPTVDFSDGGTVGAWPGDVDVCGEDNIVNGLDWSSINNYAMYRQFADDGINDFDRNGITNGLDFIQLIFTIRDHQKGDGNFGRPFYHDYMGVAKAPSSCFDGSTRNLQSLSAAVDLSLSPNSATYNVGDVFDVSVVLNTNGIATNAAGAILRFDPGVLQVVDMNPSVSGVQVTMGTLFASEQENTADNSLGVVRMSQQTQYGTFNGMGTFANVRFRVIASTGGSRTQLTVQFVQGESILSLSGEDRSAYNKLGSAGTASLWLNGSPARPLPVVSLTPASNSYIALFDQPIEATAQDSYGQVERVDFQVYYDGAWHDIGSDTNKADGWGITWDTLGVTDQVIQLRAIAWLPGELNGSATNTNILLDRTAPTYGSAQFMPSSPSGASNIQIGINTYDNLAGVQRVELYVNSASDGSTSGEWLFQSAAETGANALLNWNTSGFSNGTYQIAFAIKDNAGNWMRWDAPGLPVITYTLDFDPPVVSWVAPVGDGQVYVVASGMIQLEVSAADSFGIDSVMFNRWDAVNSRVVGIATDYSPPYTADLDVSTLNMGWNQINAYVTDIPGNVTWKYIWIYRSDSTSGICIPDFNLACGDSDTWNNGGAGSTNQIATYSCSGWNESGPEYTYRFVPSTSGSVTVTLSNMSADLDIFVLDGTGENCSASNCITYGDIAVTFNALAGQTYFLVVDGYNGAISDYTINVTCAGGPTPTPTNTPTPTDTPTIPATTPTNTPTPTSTPCVLFGDLDDDEDVDIDDVTLVASRWRTSCAKPDPDNNPDTPNYEAWYDIDGDCDIDIVDIMLVVKHWGETCE